MEYFDDISLIVFTAAEIIIQFVVVIHILLTKHEESASAILWLLVVLFFPVFGVIMYLIFGINRVNTLGISIKLANEQMNAHKNEPFRNKLAHYFEEQHKFIARNDKTNWGTVSYNRTIDRLLPETLPLRGNNLELLKDGNMAYPRMIEAMEKAGKNIHLQSFIIMNDEIGTEIFDILERKAEQGIDVKVLYDRFGSGQAIITHFFRKYSKKIPKLKILPFARVNLFTPWRIQLRNHRKLLVVDGETAFIGGINISSENVTPSAALKDKYIHDLHCKVEGPCVGYLQFSFLRDWCYASATQPSSVFTQEHFPMPEDKGEAIVRVIDSGPGHNHEASEKIFFTATATAKKYIWIMTPYFVPDISFIKALCMTAARDVEVRLIVPKKNNHWYVQYAAQSLYQALLSNGVRIFEKKGSFSHAKAMIVDGEWGFMGSSNCDVRSFRLNYELDFVISTGEFLGDLHAQFEEELSESEEVSLNRIYNKKLQLQLIENLCSLLIPVL